jgi:acyl-CoA reductase-like NAD-dependent aldehyde dehydrogenase
MEKFYQKVDSITKRIGNRTHFKPQNSLIWLAELIPICIALNPRSSMGTVISDKALQRIEEVLAPKQVNARVVAGGCRLTGPSPLDGFDLSGGYFFAPTVIEGVQEDEPIWQEEIFGPVLVVRRFDVSLLPLQQAS